MKLKYTFDNYKEFLFYIIIGTVSFIIDIFSAQNKLYVNCKDYFYTYYIYITYLYHLFISDGYLKIKFYYFYILSLYF